MSASLDLPTFIRRWQASTLTERSAAQQHFLDLCRLLGQPTPAEADPTGTFYTFEKGAQRSDGGGWADVRMRDQFAWEYKGRHEGLVWEVDEASQSRALVRPQIAYMVSERNRRVSG